METSLYDIGQVYGEWDLFQDPTPLTPAAEVRRPQVLQGWSENIYGDSSPVDEFLQGSIWTQADSPSSLESDSYLLKKDVHAVESTGYVHLSISDEDLIGPDTFPDSGLLTEDNDICQVLGMVDMQQLAYEQSSQNITEVIPSTVYSTCSSDLTQHVSSEYHLIDESDMSQDVSDDKILDLLLHDPQKVCQLLKHLGSTSDRQQPVVLHEKPILSPVSAEEVDSVLSIEQDTLEDYSTLSIKQAASEDYATLSIEHDTSQDYSTLSDDYSRASSAQGSEVPQLEFSTVHSEAYSLLGLQYEQRSPAGKTQGMVCDRKEKKKEQNKTAALKYRQKKREEKGVVLTEVEILEKKNGELKAKVTDLDREIKYLRNLIDEIRSKSS